MVNNINAQELLEKQYPKKEATEINLTELLYDIDNKELKYTEEGELKIENFPNLKEIKIDTVGEGYIDFAKIDKITISNCPNLIKIDVNTFVDNKELNITDCPNLVELDCSHNKKLEKLDLDKLVNSENNKLEILDCNSSQLNILNIKKCSNLTELNCHDNFLTGIALPKKSDKLETLDLSKNNLSNFSFLENVSLDKLENLYLEENSKFSGSLKNLKNLKDLKELDISKTTITNLVSKDLPENLEKIWCENNEKLQKELEPYKNKREKFYNYQAFRKSVNAQQWLDNHYPKDGKKETREFHKKVERGSKRKITRTAKLVINNKWLKGDLKLEQFSDLKELDCSDNYLTNLDLSDCENLTHLILSNNQFNNTDFLKTLPDKEKVKVLKMSNNERIPVQTLEFLKEFTNLEELNIEDCPFEGSLKPLKDMKSLRKIYISHTDIEEGLEHLPESCKELYCDFRYQDEHKTIKIAKELGRHIEETKEDRHYNLDKWRKEKRDGVALVIPLDKLPDNKNNIRKFLDNWNDDKVNKLKDPEMLEKRGKMINGAETSLKIPSFAGGILSLADFSRIGGALSVIAPVAEFIVEQTSKSSYEEYKKEWDSFFLDSENIWDTYSELKETFEFIKPSSSMGEVNKALKNLKERVAEFLERTSLDKIIKHATKELESDKDNKYEKLENFIKRINEYRGEEIFESKKQEINALRNNLVQLNFERYKELVINEVNNELKESELEEINFDNQLKEKIKKIRNREVVNPSELNKIREEIIEEIKKEKIKKKELENTIFQDIRKAREEKDWESISQKISQLKNKSVHPEINNSSNSSAVISWIFSYWNSWWNESKDNGSKEEITKNTFPQFLLRNWDSKKIELKGIREAIDKLQKEVSEYRHEFFGEEDVKNQQQESIKTVKDKLDRLLEALKDIESSYTAGTEEQQKIWKEHEGKVKEFIAVLQKDEEELHEELGNIVSEGEIKQHQQMDVNNKGKDKEISEDIQGQYETYIEIPTTKYGSIGSSKK